MKKFLVIQTAFIGDAILATPVLEKLNQFYPDSQIDLLLRKGNESLFGEHPFIKNLFVWDKKKGKYKALFSILKKVRKEKYDYVINLQRFATTGWFTCFSRAKTKIGFAKNPFSFCFDIKGDHKLEKGIHEVNRNLALIEDLTDSSFIKPKLYPSKQAFEKVKRYTEKPYICIAPTSVWFTKQAPQKLWINLINRLKHKYVVYMLGGKADFAACDLINKETEMRAVNLCGRLNLLESSVLMKGARMNYVNDSAPLHLTSSLNAPVRAVFCSTVEDFGFGPLSDDSKVIEVKEKLECRPCGLHGKKQCPLEHFKCGNNIDVNDLLFD